MADVRAVALSLVSIVVAIIVIATLAVPVIDQATGNVSYDGGSNGTPLATYSDATGKAVDYTWEGGVTTINGSVVKAVGQRPSVITDKVVIRAGTLNYYVYDMADSKMIYTNQISGVKIHFTMSASGSYTLYVGDQTTPYAQGTATKCLIADDNGKIGAFNGTGTIRANVGQSVYWANANWATSGGAGPMKFIELKDGSVASSWFTPFTFTNNDGNGNYELVQNNTLTYNVRYLVQEVDGEATNIGVYAGVTTTYDGNGSSTQGEWYAPLTYSGGSIVTDGGINYTLLGLVPLLLFVVAIMMAVRTMKGA